MKIELSITATLTFPSSERFLSTQERIFVGIFAAGKSGTFVAVLEMQESLFPLVATIVIVSPSFSK